MSAVCVRCGGERATYDAICPACGHRPEGEGLLVAWLLSSEHLDADGLRDVAERIRAGESVRPSERMLARARRALGEAYDSDPGLPAPQLLALAAATLVLTPVLGLVLWGWWRRQRPRTATQALLLALPVAVLDVVAVLWLR